MKAHPSPVPEHRDSSPYVDELQSLRSELLTSAVCCYLSAIRIYLEYVTRTYSNSPANESQVTHETAASVLSNLAIVS
jgi:hypothetical protein